ncbi:hypothetical protein, partial [Nitrolancea hollandica]|uniref:hypothetical protein n=1 Tax=Nitrolancea hollandica TaxID=1206749 RepID=UPI001EE64EDA
RRFVCIDGRPRPLEGGSSEPDVEDARCLNGPGDLLASRSIVAVAGGYRGSACIHGLRYT